MIEIMVNISIHYVKNIEIDKYQLDSGTWVCKINIRCITPVLEQESSEEICLFSDNKELFRNLKI